MSKSKFIRSLTLFLLVLGALWVLDSCATTPKPEPTPMVEPTPEPKPDPKPDPTPVTPTIPEPVSAAAFQAAEKAIADAESAEAERYSPELLEEARQALSDAREKAEKDPDAARALLLTSVEKANAARDAAWAAQLDALDAEATSALAEAEAVNADEHAPELMKEARQALADAREQRATDPQTAKASYLNAIERAQQARDASSALQAAAVEAELTRLDQEAQDAIAEAEAVEADQFAPEPLNAARRSLADGRDQRSGDPEAARSSYQASIEKANEARDLAAAGRTQALLDKLDAALARWMALQPERWDADNTAPLQEQTAAARAGVENNYAEGLPLATDVLAALEDATSRLGDRLVAVQDLRLQAQAALDNAESVDAYIWVPELVQAANDSFFAGTGAWKRFRLDAAEEAWSTALFQAKSAAGQAEAALQRKRTEQLMLETMKKLQDASGKTVVDPQDNIIAPKPWDGAKELEKLQKKPVSLLIPADGSVVVLGEVQRITYLDEAKEQWSQGVKALDAGDFALANEAFLQAQKLIDTYLSLAVDQLYTVRLIPDRRDSLWRISEYGDVYATPWDWPKIWKRNQKLIQNPDLIYPGWQLIIPPQ